MVLNDVITWKEMRLLCDAAPAWEQRSNASHWVHILLVACRLTRLRNTSVLSGKFHSLRQFCFVTSLFPLLLMLCIYLWIYMLIIFGVSIRIVTDMIIHPFLFIITRITSLHDGLHIAQALTLSNHSCSWVTFLSHSVELPTCLTLRISLIMPWRERRRVKSADCSASCEKVNVDGWKAK